VDVISFAFRSLYHPEAGWVPQPFWTNFYITVTAKFLTSQLRTYVGIQIRALMALALGGGGGQLHASVRAKILIQTMYRRLEEQQRLCGRTGVEKPSRKSKSDSPAVRVSTVAELTFKRNVPRLFNPYVYPVTSLVKVSQLLRDM
jgi:hypothetical protein